MPLLTVPPHQDLFIVVTKMQRSALMYEVRICEAEHGTLSAIHCLHGSCSFTGRLAHENHLTAMDLNWDSPRGIPHCFKNCCAIVFV